MKIALKPRAPRFTAAAITVSLITALLIQAVPFRVSAAETLLANRSDRISNPIADSVSNHLISFTMSDTTTPVGSISFEFCSNTPLPNTPCTLPVGFDATSASLTAQSGDTGFTVHANSNVNRIVISRPPLNPTATPSTYLFTNLMNPSNAGSYYVRLQTYTTTDGTGVDIENGGVVFVISSALSVNAEVPPYIRFCVAVTIASFDCSTANSFLIDLGELSTTTTKKASSQFLVATNAASGYTVTLSGTSLTSGNNVIPPLASPSGTSPGTSQFGINLKANSNPSVGAEVVGPGTAVAVPAYGAPNLYKFANGDTLVTSPIPSSNRKFTVSYIANISTAQAPGVYATTITYICLANF